MCRVVHYYFPAAQNQFPIQLRPGQRGLIEIVCSPIDPRSEYTTQKLMVDDNWVSESDMPLILQIYSPYSM